MPEPPPGYARLERETSSSDLPVSATLRSLLVNVYLTTLLFAVGISLPFPILPKYALHLQLSGLWLGMALSGRYVGSVGSHAASGWVVTNWGLRCSQVLCCALAAAGAALLSLVGGFWAMTLGLMMEGSGISLFMVGRMAYFRKTVPTGHRGRAISVMGGCYRLGSATGAALGGWTSQEYGLAAPFSASIPVFLVCAAICAASFECAPEDPVEVAAPGAAEPGQQPPTYCQTLARNAKTFVRAGPAVIALEMLRESRIVLIPLFGKGLGLDDQRTGLAVMATYALDTALFPLSGVLSDTCGRRASGIPAFYILSTGILAMTWADSFTGLMLVSAAVGGGNGLSAGLVMTTGTDLAPPAPETSAFIGVYNILADAGGLAAPLLVGAVSNGTHAEAAGYMVACIGYAGLLWYGCLVPETLRRKRGLGDHQ